jgi:hypothetical protein
MSAGQAIGLVKRGAKRGEVVSLNFDMYEDGTITPATLDMFRQVKKAIRSVPPVSESKPATASGEWPGGYGADQAVDGDPGTFWAFAKGDTTAWLEVDLGKPTKISRAVICEGIAAPRVPLVAEFTIEAQQADGTWKSVANGTDIGAEKALTFPAVAARKFRLHVLKSKGAADTSPVITEFQLFIPFVSAEPSGAVGPSRMKYIVFTAKHHAGFCMWDTLCASVSIDGKEWREVWKTAKSAASWEVPVTTLVSGAQIPGCPARFIRLETHPAAPAPLLLMQVEVYGKRATGSTGRYVWMKSANAFPT